ncbi:MAG TPA: hypothetical protein VKA46_01855 [Gemmataceae bacterium]|nr:hypothetical protein [Gemmataceae bacterium]
MFHDHACAVLLLRHLNKVGRGRALYRGLGSIGLVGSCRSAWLLAEDLGDPDARERRWRGWWGREDW